MFIFNTECRKLKYINLHLRCFVGTCNLQKLFREDGINYYSNDYSSLILNYWTIDGL